ncbi:LysR family transcriptional regulator [Siccirubricoccus sp. KC 17139]|uniref:LysR family transcriptional regulator n=1 Tax=Siccirubricoccus soli TaxID=2899147 RepID=A0ABT1D7Z8_9PROT|nr:LysR family transcriptional regulator [Siccirubricoccus soli]MCO6418061.1 LysR family transcriptional regulator [Siccirubricoccus soli]MCP2684196.1 LysR family transcriptional regulator [Siccirubricoccus soli]
MRAFDGIEAFVAVVETGSVTAASARLQAAKSSVSESVRALEARLGARLLDRGARTIRPTEAGQAYYTHCRRLLAEAEAARLAVQALQSAPSGRLRIAVPECFSARWLVPAMAGFLAAHPQVTVELVEGAGHARLVEDGFDLAIRVTPDPAPGLVVRRLGRSRIVIVGAPAYLAARGAPAAPVELAGHACIGFAPLAWRDQWQVAEESIAIRPVLVTDNAESLRAAALAGIGLVALPDWVVADALAEGRLCQVLPEARMPESGIFAVYPSSRLLAPTVRLFVEHILRAFRAAGLAE